MQQEILVVVADECEEVAPDGEKGWGDEVRRKLASRKEIKLSTKDLEENMTGFLGIIDRVFEKAEQSTLSKHKKMQLDEIEMLVEISGKGEFKLVAGGEIAGKGALKMKFKRPTP